MRRSRDPILHLLDDLCDVCLETPYPAPTPKDGTDLLAPGWHMVIHPFRTMALPKDEYAISMACPTCSENVFRALRIPIEGLREARELACFCGDPASWPAGVDRCATCGKVRSPL
jgi:hypothetical protein